MFKLLSEALARRVFGGAGRVVLPVDDGTGVNVLVADPGAHLWELNVVWGSCDTAKLQLTRSDAARPMARSRNMALPAVLVVLGCLNRGDVVSAEAVIEDRPNARQAVTVQVNLALRAVYGWERQLTNLDPSQVIADAFLRVADSGSPDPAAMLLASVRPDDVDRAARTGAASMPKPPSADRVALLELFDRLRYATPPELTTVLPDGLSMLDRLATDTCCARQLHVLCELVSQRLRGRM